MANGMNYMRRRKKTDRRGVMNDKIHSVLVSSAKYVSCEFDR